MLWPGVKKLGKELQLKRTDSEVVGMVKNCFVKLYDGQNMKVLEIFVPEIDDSDKENIENKLKLNKIKKIEWLANEIKMTFSEYVIPYSMSKIKEILISLTDYFSAKYPEQNLNCQKCDNRKDLEACHVDNATLFVCKDCRKLLESEISRTNIENKYAESNYLQGFLGFVLFSIPGIIVTVICFIFLDRLVGISALLYVVLGIKGYKIFKGKISRFGAGIIILSTLVMIPLGIIISYSVLIIKVLGVINIEVIIAILKMPDAQRAIMTNILLSYVISGFYLVFMLFQMMKEWKAEKTLKRARDIK